jgi:hypothetical protein
MFQLSKPERWDFLFYFFYNKNNILTRDIPPYNRFYVLAV